MSVRRFPATMALVVWTLLVWTTRVRNIWADDDLSAAAQWGRTALALSFTGLALAAGLALLRSASWRRQAVRALAGWTIAVWIVRSIGIAAADHDGAFIAAHLVLAVLSAGLAVFAVREQDRQLMRRSA
jgi:hypothetical protein